MYGVYQGIGWLRATRHFGAAADQAVETELHIGQAARGEISLSHPRRGGKAAPGALPSSYPTPV
jgi:hypothetical protein